MHIAAHAIRKGNTPMPKTRSLDDMLSSEIKQDIAERYFGFRKLIEEDKLDLNGKISHYSFILEKRISFDLVRIYVLLKDEDLISSFLRLCNLNEELFYDPYLTESPSIAKRVLAFQHFHGLTGAWRFKNYIFECYENLTFHVKMYHEKLRELEKERGALIEEIEAFYKKNDISAILGFLHSLNNVDAFGSMQGGMETGLAEGLEKKLRIEQPLPIEHFLPPIPELKPLSEIRGGFKKLIKRAYAGQHAYLKDMFAGKSHTSKRRGSDGA